MIFFRKIQIIFGIENCLLKSIFLHFFYYILGTTSTYLQNTIIFLCTGGSTIPGIVRLKVVLKSTNSQI